jgi:uncharacterized protein (TIGR02147 family)
MRTEFLEQDDFRALLKTEYERRLDRDRRYSQRAFAKDLHISSSRLSEVLKGRCGLSEDSAMAIARVLGYSKAEAEAFVLMIDSRHARSPAKRRLAKSRLQHLRQLSRLRKLEPEEIETLTDWRAYVLMELATQSEDDKGFDLNSRRWMPELGLTRETGEALVARMVAAGLVRRDGSYLKVNDEWTDASSSIPSAAIRKYHREMIEKALASIEDQPMNERELSSCIVGVRRDDLPKAKARIQDFVRTFTVEFGTAPSRETVYGLSLQFFSLIDEKGNTN